MSKGSNSMYEDHSKGLHETVESRTEKEFIDCTPTWQAALHIYLMGLEGKEESRKIAMEGLKHMAEVAQGYTQLDKTGILEENVIHIAQIPHTALDKQLITWFKMRSSFLDRDRTLSEVIFSTGLLDEACDHFSKYSNIQSHKSLYDQAFNLWVKYKDADIQYIHITFV